MKNFKSDLQGVEMHRHRHSMQATRKSSDYIYTIQIY